MFRRYLGDDVQKWAKEHNRLRMLQDTNGEGKADCIALPMRSIPRIPKRKIQARYSAAVRSVAAQLLATWNKPQNLDTVTGRWRPLHSREVQGLKSLRLLCRMPLIV